MEARRRHDRAQLLDGQTFEMRRDLTRLRCKLKLADRELGILSGQIDTLDSSARRRTMLLLTAAAIVLIMALITLGLLG